MGDATAGYAKGGPRANFQKLTSTHRNTWCAYKITTEYPRKWSQYHKLQCGTVRQKSLNLRKLWASLEQTLTCNFIKKLRMQLHFKHANSLTHKYYIRGAESQFHDVISLISRWCCGRDTHRSHTLRRPPIGPLPVLTAIIYIPCSTVVQVPSSHSLSKLSSHSKSGRSFATAPNYSLAADWPAPSERR